MGKGKAGGFYAVARGRTVGTFRTWDECKAQVDGFPNARYKKFGSAEEAQAFIEEHRGPGSTTTTTTAAFKAVGGTSVSKKVTTFASTSAGAATSLKAVGSSGSIFTFGGGGGSSSSSRSSGGGGGGGGSGLAMLRSGGSRTTTLLLSNPPNPSQMGGQAQKRTFSKTALKVTEDRVVNKRAKMGNGEVANSSVDLSNFTVDDDGYVVVFTDGACTKNGRKAAKAGIGVWFGHGHHLNISEPVNGRQTNNTAEIQAAERAIRQAKINGINKLKVKTDSQFTINCVTKWLYNWKRNNWRLSSGGDVKNKEDLIKLDESMQNMEIKWSYVAGHAGIEGNEAADRLAVAGAESSKAHF